VAWQAVQAAYAAAYNDAMKTQEGRDKWPYLAQALYVPVKLAWQTLYADGAQKVLDALAITTNYANCQGNRVITNARENYDNWIAFNRLVYDAYKTPRSTIYPANWYSKEFADQNWTKVDITIDSSSHDHSNEATSWAVSGGLDFWIISVAGGAQKSEKRVEMHSDTSNLRIKFKWAQCRISRPWMDEGILGIPNWSMGAAYPAGKISDGTRDKQQGTIMPLIPEAFIVARDIQVTAHWAKVDYDLIQESLRAGGGLRLGPLLICGRYSNSKTDSHYKSRFENGIVTGEGLHILGWINRIVNRCPPL
jgi:hypothetical protein